MELSPAPRGALAHMTHSTDVGGSPVTRASSWACAALCESPRNTEVSRRNRFGNGGTERPEKLVVRDTGEPTFFGRMRAHDAGGSNKESPRQGRSSRRRGPGRPGLWAGS